LIRGLLATPELRHCEQLVLKFSILCTHDGIAEGGEVQSAVVTAGRNGTGLKNSNFLFFPKSELNVFFCNILFFSRIVLIRKNFAKI
jgi:hypothetical protein